MQALLEVLTLERINANLFRSAVAADRHPHSLHGYFLSRGDPSIPVVLPELTCRVTALSGPNG